MEVTISKQPVAQRFVRAAFSFQGGWRHDQYSVNQFIDPLVVAIFDGVEFLRRHQSAGQFRAQDERGFYVSWTHFDTPDRDSSIIRHSGTRCKIGWIEDTTGIFSFGD